MTFRLLWPALTNQMRNANLGVQILRTAPQRDGSRYASAAIPIGIGDITAHKRTNEPFNWSIRVAYERNTGIFGRHPLAGQHFVYGPRQTHLYPFGIGKSQLRRLVPNSYIEP